MNGALIFQLDDSYWSMVYDFLRPFYDEGHWSDCGEFSPENAANYISSMLQAGVVFGAFRDMELVGMVSCEVVYEFHVRPEAYITNFYTSQHVRGQGISRKLVEYLLEYCEKQDCGNVYAANTGQFTKRANALHDNLFEKYGFEFVSRNLRKAM